MDGNQAAGGTRPFRFGVVAPLRTDVPAWRDQVRRIAGSGFSTLLMPDVQQWQPAPGPTLAVAATGGIDVTTAGLLDGTVDISVRLASGRELRTGLALPPGSPDRPPSPADLAAKLAACGPDVPGLLAGITWPQAAGLLRATLPAAAPVSA